jgi:hypothetical protein
MIETIVVCTILVVVLTLTARSIFGTVTGKNDGCGCGAGSDCSASGCCRSSEEITKSELR